MDIVTVLEMAGQKVLSNKVRLIMTKGRHHWAPPTPYMYPLIDHQLINIAST